MQSREESMKEIKEFIKENLGSMLHTALRKDCDSIITTLVWNLINLEQFNQAWKTYLSIVRQNIDALFEEETGWVALKNASQLLLYGNHQTNSLKCAFELFQEDDWRGMAELCRLDVHLPPE